MIRPRFASAVLPVLYQAQNQGQLNPGRNFQVPSKSFGVYELLVTRQHISFAIAQLHISDSNDFPRHHQLKTPHLGADRLAYLSSLGVKHTWACINHRWVTLVAPARRRAMRRQAFGFPARSATSWVGSFMATMRHTPTRSRDEHSEAKYS